MIPGDVPSIFSMAAGLQHSVVRPGWARERSVTVSGRCHGASQSCHNTGDNQEDFELHIENCTVCLACN